MNGSGCSPTGCTTDSSPAEEIEEIKDRPYRLLFVGRLSGEKNVNRLLDTVGLLDRPFEFVIVGDGEQGDDAQASGRRRRPTGIRFVGQQSGEALVDWYHWADVLVSTSDGEGMPLVFLEAMAAGVPIVGTDVPGSRETLAGVGTVVPPSAPALAEALSPSPMTQDDAGRWRQPVDAGWPAEAGSRSPIGWRRSTARWSDHRPSPTVGFPGSVRRCGPPARSATRSRVPVILKIDESDQRRDPMPVTPSGQIGTDRHLRRRPCHNSTVETRECLGGLGARRKGIVRVDHQLRSAFESQRVRRGPEAARAASIRPSPRGRDRHQWCYSAALSGPGAAGVRLRRFQPAGIREWERNVTMTLVRARRSVPCSGCRAHRRRRASHIDADGHTRECGHDPLRVDDDPWGQRLRHENGESAAGLAGRRHE